MKILFTIRSLTGGGAERVVSVLSGLLADVGEDVHIITYKTSERDYSISEKVQIHEMPQRKDSTITKGMRIFDIAVFIVQYVALRGIIKEAYRQVHYVAIGSSVLAGGVLAVLIKRMQWGSFMTLCASAIVFFGVYFLILTIAKESLVIEIENQLLGRIIKKK